MYPMAQQCMQYAPGAVQRLASDSQATLRLESGFPAQPLQIPPASGMDMKVLAAATTSMIPPVLNRTGCYCNQRVQDAALPKAAPVTKEDRTPFDATASLSQKPCNTSASSKPHACIPCPAPNA